MRVDADCGEGEFGHVGLAEDHRARLPQPPHDDGIPQRRRRGAEQQRTGRGRLACDIEKVLDRQNCSVERPERHAGSAPGIGGVGCCSCGFRIEFYEHAFMIGADGETRKDGFEAVAG
jgi:hypothetical protein